MVDHLLWVFLIFCNKYCNCYNVVTNNLRGIFMKKLSLGMLTLMSASLLASCAGKDFLLSTKKSVLDDEIILENFGVNDTYEESGKKYTVNDVNIPAGMTIVTSYFDKGVVVVSQGGNYGVYSIFARKLLVNPILAATPTVEDNTISGCLIKFEYNTNTYIIDGYGNELFRPELSEIYSSHTAGFLRAHGNIYLSLVVNFSSGTSRTIYYQYTKDGHISKLDHSPTGDTDPNVSVGDAFINSTNTTDLSNVGVSRYVVKHGRVYSVYDKNSNTLVGSIEIPSDADQTFIIGKTLFYQRKIERDLTTNKYTYNDSLMKYTLETKTVDLSARKIKAKKFNQKFVISGTKALKNAEGGVVYMALTLKEIRDDKSLGAQRILVMDEKGKFHDDLTNIGTEFYRLHDGKYYSSAKNAVYDDKFNPIFTAPGSLTFNARREFFYGNQVHEDKTYMMLVNSEGKYLTSYYYDASVCDYVYGNVVLMSKDGFNEYYNMASGSTYGYVNESSSRSYAVGGSGSGLYMVANLEGGTWTRSFYNIEDQSLVNADSTTSWTSFYQFKSVVFDRDSFITTSFVSGGQTYYKVFATTTLEANTYNPYN